MFSRVDLDLPKLQSHFHVESRIVGIISDHAALDEVLVRTLEETPHFLGVSSALLGRDQHGDVPLRHLLGGHLEGGDHLAVGLHDHRAAAHQEGAGGLLLALGADQALPLLQLLFLEGLQFLVVLDVSVGYFGKIRQGVGFIICL